LSTFVNFSAAFLVAVIFYACCSSSMYCVEHCKLCVLHWLLWDYFIISYHVSECCHEYETEQNCQQALYWNDFDCLFTECISDQRSAC